MYSVLTLEQACADAWPPLVGDKIGDWRLRAAAGFTGRANSALAVGDPGMPVARALEIVCDFAHSNGIPPMAHAIRGGAVEDALTAAGWTPHATHPRGFEVSVLTAPVDGATAPEVRVLDAPTPDWWRLAAGSPEPTAAQRHVLTGAPLVGYGVAEAGGETAGTVRAAVVDDLLHISVLAVDPAFRRRGLAKALLRAGGAWGAERGARTCVLQVATHNDPALGLYRALGFTEHHRYRYWVPAVGAACEDPTS
ncbi:GNAT family N-acetyltransferase [Amycolatopsis anabasis]|uniref:GNAT family N-acetyltransferase n=1 Tax=Amycolatopsis anabasis TaxID=1840409 RepID=UPI00131B2FD0|nr:N-acetyltransferase [Amycolatopsis anabasis]